MRSRTASPFSTSHSHAASPFSTSRKQHGGTNTFNVGDVVRVTGEPSTDWSIAWDLTVERRTTTGTHNTHGTIDKVRRIYTVDCIKLYEVDYVLYEDYKLEKYILNVGDRVRITGQPSPNWDRRETGIPRQYFDYIGQIGNVHRIHHYNDTELYEVMKDSASGIGPTEVFEVYKLQKL